MMPAKSASGLGRVAQAAVIPMTRPRR